MSSLSITASCFDAAVFHKNRIIRIEGHNTEKKIQNLCEDIPSLRNAPDEKITEEEKLLISSRYRDLMQRVGQGHEQVLFSLSQFLPQPTKPFTPRIGLEAEYMYIIRAPESTPLKYDQRVATVSTPDNKLLAHLKLDGISQDETTAILELECRPYPLDSSEFSLQLQTIENLRQAIRGAETGSSVQELLDDCKLQVLKEKSLVFVESFKGVGPFCQVTVELHLSRLGDPEDKAILELVEDPPERKLLQHARDTADVLVRLMRPTASKIHGDIYNPNSIKLANLRGYWAQSIMQACQVIHYEKKKEYVGFHIRTAGPYRLSARDKALLKAFFNARAYPSEFNAFKETLENGLKTGVALLASADRSVDPGELALIYWSLMADCEDFAPRDFQFKSGNIHANSPSNLEFAYGMTLVELRDVHSSLNRGIMQRSQDAYLRIKNAQAQPAPGPKKTFKKLETTQILEQKDSEMTAPSSRKRPFQE